ncbi:cytochrome P450 [Bacteriovorax sp. Seq25_V]|uniref:cytochrome P450 n=1 Tax=Bacteriovorax sp. Seq25_V TaxID=1201288 RepID=UPI000389E66B|nr:cytochrome P450 [Bacteriovorax sp. Seq25_V]EQC44058.1 unspecific monooxygenase [Bacteriovorax sp. Seq25_V]
MANENRKSSFKKAITFVRLSHIPGPRGLKYINYVKEFQKNILAAFTQTHNEYGKIASFPWPMNSVIIYDPKMIKEVLIENNRSFIKGEQIEEIRAVVGNGLATNNDFNLWLRNRTIISKEFGNNAITRYEPSIKNITSKMVANFSDSINICDFCKKVTFDIACEIFLGSNLGEEKAKIVSEAVDYTSIVTYERIFEFFPIPYWVPTKKNFKFKRHFKNLETIVMELITKERENPRPTELSSVLQRLVHAKDEETGTSLRDDELRDEILTIMLAGHETTAHTLSWIFGLLAKHQDIQEKLFIEIQRNDDYLDLVIHEAMRLYPAFPVLSRKASKDTQIGDLQIFKNTNVVIPIYVMQRSEKYHQDPLEFKPDRFITNEINKEHRSIPFSKGPRRCIGELFSLSEIKIIIKEVLNNFQLELSDELPLAEAYVSLRPKKDILIKLTSRL